jgi:hypothetical protein
MVPDFVIDSAYTMNYGHMIVGFDSTSDKYTLKYEESETGFKEKEKAKEWMKKFEETSVLRISARRSRLSSRCSPRR